MPRARDTIVPVAVKGIEEVISRHTKTKRGTIRTTEKVVPVVRAPKVTSGQSSQPIKKGKLLERRPDEGQGSDAPIHVIDDTQTHIYSEEQEYDLPDVAPERIHATVSITFNLCGWNL